MEVLQPRKRFSLKSIFRPDSQSVLDIIIRWSMFLAVFLIPIFFLTSTQDMFDLNKSLLFCLLTLIGVLAWLGKIVFKKGFNFRRTALDVPLVIFGFLYIIVSLFSQNWHTSIAGQASYYHHTLVVTIFFILFYFLLVNNFRTKKDVQALLGTLIISTGFVAIVSLLQLFGAYIFLSEATKSIGFNLIFNSVVILGLFLAIMLPVILSFLVFTKNQISRALLIILGIIDFTVLFILDINLVWYTAIGGLFVFLVLLTMRSKDLESRWAILPTVLLVLSAIFIFVNVSDLTNVVVSEDIVLDHQTTWSIAKSTLSDSPLFGTGPEVFSQAFAEHRPLSFNDTILWSLSFIKGSSEFMQILITTGLLVTVVYLYLFIRFLITFIAQATKKDDDKTDWLLKAAIFLPWLALFVISFFYPFSFVLSFMLWLLLALGTSLVTKDKGEVLETKPSPAIGFSSSIAFSLLVVLGIVFLYGAGSIWLGEYNYVKGNKAMIDEDVVTAQQKYDRAIELDGERPLYYFALAQSFIEQADSILPQSNDEVNQISDLVTLAQVAASQGLAVDIEDPILYSSFINVYADVLQFDPNVYTDISAAYDKLIELDPNNPLNYVEAGDNNISMGQLVLSNLPEDDEEQAQQMTDEVNKLFQSAQDYYQKGAELKTDYVIAELKHDLAYELLGDIDTTIDELKKLAEAYPTSVDAHYELGRIYYATEQTDLAKQQFVAVLNLNPDHANAGYQLGEIVQAEGDKDTAITLFTRVLANNPDDENVRQKLEELGVTIEDQREKTSE